ncbi:hypothetical protein Ahy_A09g042740 [Arachis hypogaea]|uniref:Uncharacterized protein n=1 Tax=Arachis hypogaea TaxID=3818 RepID=A0A445BGM6_ARAHY|nr:hypothetical protein Ahy_A09g042740 [Arachis hypogaea]
MLKQHRKLSMFVHRTVENNNEAGIRPSKTYQSFVTTGGSHCELSFIEKDVRNYITREVHNVFELDDAKEFEKYLLRMKEKNHNFFFELELEVDHSIKIAFWVATRSRVVCNMVLETISGFRFSYCHTVYNKSSIEDQFQHVYTHEKFKKVQAQFRGNVNCFTTSTEFALGFTAYEVVEHVSNSTFNKFVVTYDAISREIKCQCLLFESREILCHHSLNALSFK